LKPQKTRQAALSSPVVFEEKKAEPMEEQKGQSSQEEAKEIMPERIQIANRRLEEVKAWKNRQTQQKWAWRRRERGKQLSSEEQKLAEDYIVNPEWNKYESIIQPLRGSKPVIFRAGRDQENRTEVEW